MRPLFRLVLASLILTASATAALAQGNVLHRGISGEPGTLDPELINGTWEHIVVEDLFLGLTTDDAHADTIPGLAKSWTISDDKTRYTLKLRDDVKWTDGTPVTAEDAVFGLRRAVNPLTASPNASLLYIIKNAAADQCRQDEAGPARRQRAGRSYRGDRSRGAGALFHRPFVPSGDLSAAEARGREIRAGLDQSGSHRHRRAVQIRRMGAAVLYPRGEES